MHRIRNEGVVPESPDGSVAADVLVRQEPEEDEEDDDDEGDRREEDDDEDDTTDDGYSE